MKRSHSVLKLSLFTGALICLYSTFPSLGHAQDYATKIWQHDQEAGAEPIPPQLKEILNAAIQINIKQQKNFEDCKKKMPEDQQDRCDPVGASKFDLELVEKGRVRVNAKKPKAKSETEKE
ncbi:hypothetical protein OAO01_03460 [Oligoflexia bacterium]|nr:hypothetical protein [Oligoflexia bacterium]